MSRRTDAAIAAAAQQASEAARVLQVRSAAAQAEAKAAAKPAEFEAEPQRPVHREPATPEEAERIARIPRGNIHRQKIMDEISQARGEPKDETPSEAPAVAKPQEPPTQPAPRTPAAPVTETVPEQPPAPSAAETVKVKVDGEEFDAPKADVDAAGGVTAYQINRAAENRLKKANEAVAAAKSAADQNAALQQIVVNLLKGQQPAQPPQTDEQFIASMVDTIRFGTPEESAAALQKVLNRNRVDPGAIAIQATVSMKYDLARQAFAKEFADVLANPVLAEAARAFEMRAMQPYFPGGQPDYRQMAGLDFGKIFSTIGNQIRAAVPRPSQPQPPAQPASGTTSQLPDKEARKASIVEPPKSAARAAVTEEKQLTPEEERKEAIKLARKARGLPVE